jgi:hypothetical protein
VRHLAGGQTPWLRLLGCASWPLVIPVGLWFVNIHEMRKHLWSPDARVLPEAKAHLTERWIIRFASPEVLLCLALALLACWVVYRRLFGFPVVLGARVLMDVALVVGFAAAPWIVWTVIRGEPKKHTVLDAWMMPGLLYRAVSCICAALAVTSCVVLRRKRRDTHEVAAA